MKKILIVHNKYRHLGGEDIAVEREISFLKKRYDIELLFFENSTKDFLFTFLSFFNNKNYKSIKLLKEQIESHNPDNIYFHNTWFKGSVGLIKYSIDNNYNTLIKLHNFRYFCTRSIFSKNHLNKYSYCGACGLNMSEVGIFNKYFKTSILKSIFVIRYGVSYFKLLKNENVKLLVLTNFHKEFLLNLGFSEKNIIVLRNSLSQQLPEIVKNKKEMITYAGRVSNEKGVEEIINSFLKSDLDNFTLNIIGDGPSKKFLQKKYNYKNIQFFGELPNIETLEIINNSLAVITGTKLFEGQPTLLTEASFLKVVSIFPKLGGIGEFFPKNYDLAFENNNESDLINKINKLKDYKSINSIKNENYLHITKLLDDNKLGEKYIGLING